MRKQIKMDSVLGIVTILLSLTLYLFIIPWQIRVPLSIKGTYLSPAYAPQFFALFLGLLGVILLCMSLWAQRKGVFVSSQEEGSGETLTGYKIIMMLWLYLLLIVFLVEYLGIVIPSILFIATTMFYVGNRRPFFLLIISISVPLFLYLFFLYGARVPLPRGIFLEMLF